MQCACIILSSVASPAVLYFFCYLIFSGGIVIEHKMCRVYFLYKFCLNHHHSNKN